MTPLYRTIEVISKKTKLESLGLCTRVYIQVMRALKLLPKVCEP